MCGRSYASQIVWLLGYPAQAAQWNETALTLAQELAHPFTLAHTLSGRREEAELYRPNRELLWQAGTEPEEAEAWRHQVLNVACHQQAKSLELRVAMSLSRLWQQQSKRDAACTLLAPIYGWFTEEFDTAALLETKAFLEDLE